MMSIVNSTKANNTWVCSAFDNIFTSLKAKRGLVGDIGDTSYKITFLENNLQIGTHGTNRDTWDKEAHILLRPYNSYIIYILCSLNVNFYMKEELLWVREDFCLS